MVSPVPPTLAPTLRRLRLAHGFKSQAKLAEAAGLSPSTIGNVEAGSRNLGRESCDVVAVVLGLSADEYSELMAAAGHDQRRDQVSTFDERLSRVEAEVAEIRKLVSQVVARPPRSRTSRGGNG